MYFFKGIPLFSGLSDAEHQLLLRVAIRRSYPRHTLLIQESDVGESLYLLRDGRAKVYRSEPDGREVILSILGPGDFFGEMALLDEQPCSASVLTMEACEFFVIGKEDFRHCLAANAGMAANLLRAMSRRLREADQQIESLALKDVQARVQLVLRQLAQREDGRLVVPARVTHRDIAGMTGASREMVTRVFRHLEASGFVQVDGRRITLVEPASAAASDL
jgi:CRP/FNR family cyclic AMP-dependent transcriptional regulator